MSKKIQGYVLIGFLLSCQEAFGLIDGNQLLNWCNNKTEELICLGYIIGAGDEQDMNMAMTGNFYYCLPSNMTFGQMKNVVLKYMEQYPENLHLGAWQMVAFAYKEYFPCNPQQLRERHEMYEESQKLLQGK